MAPIDLTGHKTDGFILALANGERSEGLWTIPANTDAMLAGTIVTAAGAAAAVGAPTTAAAILRHPTEELTTDQKAAVIQRDAEVYGEKIAWPAGATDAQKVAFAEHLATLGIIVRWEKRPALQADDAELPDDLPAE